MASNAPRSQSPDVLAMAAPLVVSFWMRSLFTFVDTFYAATLGDAAVAAIGLSIPFEFLMIAVWVGLSTGLTSNIARAMGARQGSRVEQYLSVTWRLVWATVPVFAGVGAACWIFAPRLAPDAETARQFAIYGAVLIGGSAFSTFWSVIPDSVVKAHGDTKATMWAGIWSNVINVVLNTIFTFVFHWGIFGIALSTVVGRFGGLIYALNKAAGHQKRWKQEGHANVPGLDVHPYRSLFALAVPAALGYCLMATEGQIVNTLLAGLSNAREAIAAYGIHTRVFQFTVMPAIATAVAMLPFAARRFGEGDVAGIRSGLRRTHVAGLIYCAVAAPILWLGAAPLARALSSSPITQAYATFAVRVIPLACLAAMPIFLCRPVFEGMGRGRPGLVIAMIRYLGFTAPAAWLGIHFARAWGVPGLYGLIVGLICAAAVASGIFVLWVRGTLRKIPSAVPEPAVLAPDAG
jgi:putative MATE family efflux protein